MFCTVCAAYNGDGGRTAACAGCGAGLRATSGTARRGRAGRAMTIAGLLPIAAVLALLLALVGRSWQQDRQREDDYRAAEAMLAEDRPLAARQLFAELDGYRDAGRQAARLEATLAPLELRARLAGDLLARGETARAIVELREVVSLAPELEEATLLLERARLALIDEVIAAADRLVAAEDVAGARMALVAGLELEPAGVAMRDRLRELDAEHPLLLLTNAGDVALAEPDGERQRVLVSGRDASWAVWSPDRSRAAFMSATGLTDEWISEIWVVDADGGNQRMVAGDAFRAGAPSWSPDGRTIVYLATDEFDRGTGGGWIGLRAVDLESGAQRDLTRRRFDFATSVVWSPDGRQLAFVERHVYRVEDTAQLDVSGGDVFVLDLHTGETRNLTNGRIEDAFWVSWSPRGDRMLVVTDVDEWATAEPVRLVELDVATGEIAEVETSAIVTSYPYWSPDGSMFAVVQDDRTLRMWSEDGGESWVRLPTNIDRIITWAPDGSALIVPPKAVQDVTYVVHVGDQLGRIDRVRVMFDNSYSSGGPPQWGPRTQPVREEASPSGTALD